MVTRRQTFRLYPNKAQEKALFDARRLHCYLDNACIANRHYESRANQKTVSYLEQQIGNESALTYESLVAFDLGTQTALTLDDGENFTEVSNPRFTQKAEGQIKAKSKALRRQRAPNRKKKIKASMISYKIESKGGLMLMLTTKKIQPSQRCPNCGKIHKNWAELSNRYHVCDDCRFEIPRDRGSVMVMCKVTTNQQRMLLDMFLLRNGARSIRLGLGTSLIDCGVHRSTNSTGKRKHTGSMKQLGHMKRQKSNCTSDRVLETPSVLTAG